MQCTYIRIQAKIQRLLLPAFELLPNAFEKSFVVFNFFFQCAMEENCLAEEAYRMRRENPNFTLETRRLLRFTTSIENIGDADFRPFIPKSAWQWHACHMHYHSMEVCMFVLGVKVRKLKMDFITGGTWRRVGQ